MSTDTQLVRLGSERAVGSWLVLCAFLIFVMVSLGGVTRLTGSGLSMVHWEPLSGVIPPISEADWQDEFSNYRATPEYGKVNLGMDVDEFKTIFYFEYTHRMLGRLIGLVFLLPFMYFYFRRRIEKRVASRYLIMLILGGLQGLLGWYMVQSGLVDVPTVSHYRLTAHLAAAILIYSYILWMAFPLLLPRGVREYKSGVGGKAVITMLIILLTLLSGGFVAGLKAGHVFNTFPLMAGHIIPVGYFLMDPWWRNLFDNIPAVQFYHRYLGILTFISVCLFVFNAWRDLIMKRHHWALTSLLLIVTIQGLLGISTLLLHVPVVMATAHQGAGLLLLTVALYIVYLTGGKIRSEQQ